MKRQLVLAEAYLLLFFCNMSGLNAQQSSASRTDAASSLLKPYKTMIYSVPEAAQGRLTPPVFNHGYLLQFRRTSSSSGEPNIFLYDCAEQVQRKVAMWIAGAKKISLTSVDISSGGRLVVAGLITKADGTKLAFLATSNLEGANALSFSTGNYLVSHLAAADDGSIWTVGTEHAISGGSGNLSQRHWANYDVVRRFSPSGEIVDHFLPRWGANTAYVVEQTDTAGIGLLSAYDVNNQHLTDYRAPLWGPYGGYGDVSISGSQIWLKTVQNGVLVYDGRSGLLYHHDSGSSGLISEGVETEKGGESQTSGVAATGDGSIFATFQPANGQRSPIGGLMQLIADPAGGLDKWTPLAFASESSPPDSMDRSFRILGADGTAVVYMTTGHRVMWSVTK